jgi:signal transduction histidine kinase
VAADVVCETDLPDDPVMVTGEPEELFQLLGNLVGNAIKYTDPGGRVDVRVIAEGDDVVVTVTDTGIGISEHDQAQLFREFFRSTNPAALVRPGTGLGLSIVSRIVKRHAGAIEVASERGEGTTVTVVLPAHAGAPVGEPDGAVVT